MTHSTEGNTLNMLFEVNFNEFQKDSVKAHFSLPSAKELMKIEIDKEEVQKFNGIILEYLMK